MVKTLRGEHTCVGDPKGRNPLANSGWVAKQLEEDVACTIKYIRLRILYWSVGGSTQLQLYIGLLGQLGGRLWR